MKGRIMEINNGCAIVLTKNGEFVKTRNYKKASVGDEITVRSGLAGYTKAIAAAAAMVAVFCGSAVTYCMPTSYVDICINPEIELKLNMFDIVIGAEGQNDDGVAVLSKENVKNAKLKDALDDIIENAESLGFIPENEKKTVVLSVFAKNEGTAKNLYESVKAYEVSARINKVVKMASNDDVTNANAENLSVGKYLLVNEVADAVPVMSKEEWKNHSVKEIITTLDKAKENTADNNITAPTQAENSSDAVGKKENVIENNPKISPKPEKSANEPPKPIIETKFDDTAKPQIIKTDEKIMQKPPEENINVYVGDAAPKNDKQPITAVDKPIDDEPMSIPRYDNGNDVPITAPKEENAESKPAEIENRDNAQSSNNNEFDKPPINGSDNGGNNGFDESGKYDFQDDNKNDFDNEPVNNTDDDMTLQNGNKNHSASRPKSDNDNPNGEIDNRQDAPSDEDFNDRPSEDIPSGGTDDRHDKPSDNDFEDRPSEDTPSGDFDDRHDRPFDGDFDNRPNENPNGGLDDRQDEPNDKDFDNRPSEDIPSGGFNNEPNPPFEGDFDSRPNDNPNDGFDGRQDEGTFDRDFDDRADFDMPNNNFDDRQDEPSERDFDDNRFDGEKNDAPNDNSPSERESGFDAEPFGE